MKNVHTGDNVDISNLPDAKKQASDRWHQSITYMSTFPSRLSAPFFSIRQSSISRHKKKFINDMLSHDLFKNKTKKTTENKSLYKSDVKTEYGGFEKKALKSDSKIHSIEKKNKLHELKSIQKLTYNKNSERIDNLTNASFSTINPIVKNASIIQMKSASREIVTENKRLFDSKNKNKNTFQKVKRKKNKLPKRTRESKKTVNTPSWSLFHLPSQLTDTINEPSFLTNVQAPRKSHKSFDESSLQSHNVWLFGPLRSDCWHAFKIVTNLVSSPTVYAKTLPKSN